MPLIPLNNLYSATNANNQLANVTKSNGGKGNRKQQQQQQQKQTTSIAQPGRKNGKQQNGKNQNGNKNWKQRLTTPRPPTTLLSREQKMEFINNLLNLTSWTTTTTTTQRPIKLSNNNVDNKDINKLVYVKTPIKAPKQIKEITTVSNRVNITSKLRNDTNVYAAAAAAIPTKPSVTTIASTFDAHVEFVDSIPYTSNPNIPKYFQRYEKIQEFYPEFHPYIAGLPKASSSISGSSSSSSSIAVKPSRDGSKNSHFMSTSNQQSSFSSAESASSSADASKKSQSLTVISSKTGKG